MDLRSEKKLVKAAKKDSEIFSQLYEDNYSRIFGYILNRVTNIEVAQDITSETFFKSLKNIKKFKWKNISFSCWLYRIASNEISNYFRKNKYQPVGIETIAEPVALRTPHDEIIEAEDKFEIQKELLKISKAISQLPNRYQEVISLKYFEKKKIEEICQILGRKEGTIKSLLYRGIKILKQILANETF